MSKLVTCSDVVKRGSCHLFSALHPRDRFFLTRIVGTLNDLPHTLEVYRKVLHVLDFISEGPFRTVVH